MSGFGWSPHTYTPRPVETPTADPTLARLAFAAELLSHLTADQTIAAEARDTLIADAHHAGHSLRTIAAAAGLSHQRVAQILDTQQ